MSFEGYYRFLCARGHLSEYDVYSLEIGKCEEWDAGGCVMNWNKLKCSCGNPMVWFDLIDTTNDDGHTQLEEKKIIQIRPAEIATCENCGKTHACTPAMHNIPKTFGQRIEA
jgi:hypothetical protein